MAGMTRRRRRIPRSRIRVPITVTPFGCEPTDYICPECEAPVMSVMHGVSFGFQSGPVDTAYVCSGPECTWWCMADDLEVEE